MSDKIIFQSKWKKVKESEHGYQYLERNGVNSIAVFLTRIKNNILEVLIRYQPLPLDESDDQKLFPCPITGSIDLGDSIKGCALREVEEEAGYVLNNLNDLGYYAVGSQTNELVYMLWEDVTNIEPTEKRKDDGFFESISKNVWEPFENLKNYNYSACQIMYYKIKEIREYL